MTDSSVTNKASEILQAEVLIQFGTIEALKDDSVRQSAKFWKAVEMRNRIQFELKKRLNAAQPLAVPETEALGQEFLNAED